MTAREPFWGLVQQNGPWRQTANDKRHAREQDPNWTGGGVGTGGTRHAGNGNWREVTNPDRQRSSAMPAPPPPSKYALPNVVDNNKPYPRGYLPDMPGYEDFQKVLDEESDALKKGLGITDHVPYLYPQAGAFERSLDMLMVGEADHLSPDPEMEEAIRNAKSEEAMDMMAGGQYRSSAIKANVRVDGEENIIHLTSQGNGSMSRPRVVHIYRPPKLGLEAQAAESSRLRVMMDTPNFNPMAHLDKTYGDHANHFSRF